MNPSRIFILRPVGTTLLMAAILLVGIIAYRVPADLGTSRGRLSNHPSPDLLSRRQSGGDDARRSRRRWSGSSDRCRASGRCPRFRRAAPRSSRCSSRSPQPRRRRAGGAGGDQCRHQPPALRPAGAADLQQGEPGRRAHPDPRADQQDAAADPGRGPGGRATGAEDQPAARRWPGLASAVAIARRSAIVVNPRALSAYGLAIDDVRTIIGTQNTDTPKGGFDGPVQSSTINDNDQLTSANAYRDLVIAYKNGRAGAAARHRNRGRRRRKQPARRLGEPHTRGHPQRPAPARFQRDRGGRRHQAPVAAAAGDGPGGRRRGPCSATAPTPSALRSATWSSSSGSRWRWSCW